MRIRKNGEDLLPGKVAVIRMTEEIDKGPMVTLQIIKVVEEAVPPADGALSKEETGNTLEEKEAAVEIEEKKQIEPKAVEAVAQIKINGNQKERKCKQLQIKTKMDLPEAVNPQ